MSVICTNPLNTSTTATTSPVISTAEKSAFARIPQALIDHILIFCSDRNTIKVLAQTSHAWLRRIADPNLQKLVIRTLFSECPAVGELTHQALELGLTRMFQNALIIRSVFPRSEFPDCLEPIRVPLSVQWIRHTENERVTHTIDSSKELYDWRNNTFTSIKWTIVTKKDPSSAGSVDHPPVKLRSNKELRETWPTILVTMLHPV